MNPIKKIASQTAIYGVSSIVGRFLNYLLVPLYTRFFTPIEYGVISELYAYSGFLIVLLIFGMETAIFRFAKGAEKEKSLQTILSFLVSISTVFVVLIFSFSSSIATTLAYQNYGYYFVLFAFILAFDTVGSVPFAYLRLEEKAKQFATIKLIEIFLNIGFNILFVAAKVAHEKGNGGILSTIYIPEIGVGYIFIANLISSGFKLIFLSDILVKIGLAFDKLLFKKILSYAAPMVVIGFAGIINEMLDRSMMKFLLPGTTTQNLAQLGIYSACYKVSIVMSLFIQAFRFAAEPFFFSMSDKSDAKKVYADVMDWFVWFCTGIFCVVTIFTEEFGLFVGEAFRSGLFIVPILLLANLLLGIYVNLSIWYKLTDKTQLGAGVSIAGAAITMLLLYFLVPIMGYEGAAWATLVCYGFMVIVSYSLGQKYFPVAYSIPKILGYLVFCVGVWGISFYLGKEMSESPYIWKTILTILCIIIMLFDKKNILKKLLRTYAS